MRSVVWQLRYASLHRQESRDSPSFSVNLWHYSSRCLNRWYLWRKSLKPDNISHAADSQSRWVVDWYHIIFRACVELPELKLMDTRASRLFNDILSKIHTVRNAQTTRTCILCRWTHSQKWSATDQSRSVKSNEGLIKAHQLQWSRRDCNDGHFS